MIKLYIKTHNITGLKYFGKTIQKDPHKYKGSGIHWKRHIKKHGNDVTTVILKEFDEDDLTIKTYALEFSKIYDIVNSNKWANMKAENGLDGGTMSDESQQNAINSQKEFYKNNPEFIKLRNEKSSRTKQKIQSNGKTSAQNGSELTAKRRKENGTTNAGSQNGRSRKIEIFDENGIKRFSTEGDFSQVCEKFGISVASLYRTLKRKTPLVRGKHKGWCAKYLT